MEKYIVEELKKLPYTLRELSQMTGLQITRVQRIKTGFPLWASELLLLSDFLGKELPIIKKEEAQKIIEKAREDAAEIVRLGKEHLEKMTEDEAIKLLSAKHNVPVGKILWAIGAPE